MTPEGFYRVTLEGHPGVGCCRHYTSVVREETYEDWQIMYVRPFGNKEPLHIMTAHINSTDRYFSTLSVGKRIPGLRIRFDAQKRS